MLHANQYKWGFEGHDGGQRPMGKIGQDTFTFAFIHLADAFIKSNLQIRKTASNSLRKAYKLC